MEEVSNVCIKSEKRSDFCVCVKACLIHMFTLGFMRISYFAVRLQTPFGQRLYLIIFLYSLTAHTMSICL